MPPLWIAHTHLMDCWESTPRIAFLSPEPASGKTRALEVTEPLVPRPVHAVNTTPAYLFRKVSDPAGPPTILYDEIDTVFGPKAKDNEEIRGMLNAGHRKGAVAGRCVITRQDRRDRGAARLLRRRARRPGRPARHHHDPPVVVRMKPRARTEKVKPWRLRTDMPIGLKLGERLADWADSVRAARQGLSGRRCRPVSRTATPTSGRRCWRSPTRPAGTGRRPRVSRL